MASRGHSRSPSPRSSNPRSIKVTRKKKKKKKKKRPRDLSGSSYTKRRKGGRFRHQTQQINQGSRSSSNSPDTWYSRPAIKPLTKLETIPDWSTLYASMATNKDQAPQATWMKEYDVDTDINKTVTMWRGDMTTLGVDAIQNAANTGLWSGGGICGAIHLAAGPELEAACERVPEVVLDRTAHSCGDGIGVSDGADGAAVKSYDNASQSTADNGNRSVWRIRVRCPCGETRVTPGFRLHAKNVLHTVGPTSHDESALRRAYESTLEAAKASGFASIALCCISTGIYGFPSEDACPIALTTVRAWLEKNRGSGHPLKRIIFCVFTPKDNTLYRTYMPYVFPCEKEKRRCSHAAYVARKQNVPSLKEK